MLTEQIFKNIFCACPKMQALRTDTMDVKLQALQCQLILCYLKGDRRYYGALLYLRRFYT